MKRIFGVLFIILMIFAFATMIVFFSKDAKTADLNIDPDRLMVSKPMTFDELVTKYTDDTGLSFAESRDILSSQMSSEVLTESVKGDEYRTISTTIEVTNDYLPTLNFYCLVNSDRYYGFIKEVLGTALDRNYNGISYQFEGQIYYNLEDPTTLYYLVNGDWYENRISVFISGSEVNYSNDSNTAKHYAYTYVDGRIHWGNLK